MAYIQIFFYCFFLVSDPWNNQKSENALLLESQVNSLCYKNQNSNKIFKIKNERLTATFLLHVMLLLQHISYHAFLDKKHR